MAKDRVTCGGVLYSPRVSKAVHAAAAISIVATSCCNITEMIKLALRLKCDKRIQLVLYRPEFFVTKYNPITKTQFSFSVKFYCFGREGGSLVGK